MKIKVGVIDVGLGNISSIIRMIDKSSGLGVAINHVSELDKVDKVILPGVGHFDKGIELLRGCGLAEAISRAVIHKRMNVLGICLGMQLLCRGSEEGKLPGLGLIDADVKKFNFSAELGLKVPHMGWNSVSAHQANPLLPINSEEQRFYFVHSYKVVPDDLSIMIGAANYGGEFCAAFQRVNVFGVQFHPEKSHRFGMALMRRFIEL